MTTVDVIPRAEDTEALFTHWDRLRKTAPVLRSARTGAWLVVSYEAALAAFEHRDLTMDNYDRVRPSPLPLPSSFELDAASNRLLRSTVVSCIGPRTMPFDVIDDGCAEIFDAAPVGRPADFVTGIAEPTARALTRRWFGFDDRELAAQLALFAVANNDPDTARRAAAGRLATRGMLDTIEHRRAHPRGDLLSRLATAWHDAGAEDWWLVAFLAPMFNSLVGGFGARLLTHTALHLAGAPALQDDVRAGGWKRARLAAMEAARLDPVNPSLPRRAREPVHLAGVTVPAKEDVWVVLPAACRDPAAYEAPHEFRIDRTERSLAFGWGPHMCSGRELALAVAATAVTEMLVRQGMRLLPVPDDPPTFHFGFGRACVRLPVVLTRH